MIHPRVCRANQGGEIAMRSGVDISGIPLFYVNRIISSKMDDGNVMIVCGIQRGADFTPLYATVSPAGLTIEDGEPSMETTRIAVGTAH